jgi:hypothetical protein
MQIVRGAGPFETDENHAALCTQRPTQYSRRSGQCSARSIVAPPVP